MDDMWASVNANRTELPGYGTKAWNAKIRPNILLFKINSINNDIGQMPGRICRAFCPIRQ
jgi:hypothetical protein